ncbi:MAG TPA: hypothetical protein DCE23_08180 [Firmicutes bacterium]|nr:hypothetical protein [Bacillota bacterium]
MAGYDYLTDAKVATNIVGEFVDHKNDEFKQCLENLTEGFKQKWGFNIWDRRNFVEAMGRPEMASLYKNLLIGDVIKENLTDDWFDGHGAKLEQLFENSVDTIIKESTIQELNPIVSYTLPILKKNYYECISKEIMMTQVPNEPFIRMAFERSFLQDKEGNKYYIPEVFYNDEYKEISAKAMGDDIRSKLEEYLVANAGALDLPVNNFNVLTACGGSKSKRDELDYDFCIDSITVTRVPDAGFLYRAPLKVNPAFNPAAAEDVTTNPKYVVDTDHPAYIDGNTDKDPLVADTIEVKDLAIEPNYASQGTFYGVVNYEMPACTAPSVEPDADAAGVAYPGVLYVSNVQPQMKNVTLFGKVDTHMGIVSVSSPDANVTSVMFGGHLSNQNNEKFVDIDYERTPIEWKIEERETLNAGLTLKKIKDTQALANIDITAKLISDMTTTLTQFEDSDTLTFARKSLDKWRDKKDLPFGYAGHISKGSFVEEATFSAEPQTGITALQPTWIDEILKYHLERLLIQLNKKLYNKNLMYVIYGNPANVSLLRNHVKWVVSNDTKVGGVQLEYKFGLLNGTDFRIHVVSSMKVPEEEGLRILAYPTSNEIITFKHFKYSFNIENQYRNSATPLIPNIMATHRFKTVELTPVQGAMYIINNGFGNNNPQGVKFGTPGYIRP